MPPEFCIRPATAPLVTRMFAGPDSTAHKLNLIRTESATETGVIAFLGSANQGLRFEVAPTSHERIQTACAASCITKETTKSTCDSGRFQNSLHFLWEW